MYESEFIKNIKGQVAYLALLNRNNDYGYDYGYTEISGEGYERVAIIFNDIYFDETDEGMFSKVEVSFNESKSFWGRVDAVAICQDKDSKSGYINDLSRPNYVSAKTQIIFQKRDIKILYPKIKNFY